ncbi:MAG: 4Fe-4S dicluster domain-containing protein [Dehalococcoidia bacterium]
MHEHTLKALQQHYDLLPIGLPELPSRVEKGLLNVLFTEEEAHAALHMTPHGHTPVEMAQKMGKTEKDLLELVETMFRKGLILREEKEGQKVYSLVPLVPGIYEFQLGVLNKVLSRLVEVLLPEYAPHLFGDKTPLFKVVPAETSLPVDVEISPYERASEIVREAKVVGLADCLCRKERMLTGHPCDSPKDEICIVFHPWAEAYIERGIAKEVSVDEAMKAIDRAEQAGLVRCTTNNKKNPLFMCQCCSCCCGILRGFVDFGLPRAFAHSNFVPAVSKESCDGCGDCIKICTMHALDLRDDKAKMDGTRCIGCGLCATACSNGSIVMRRKGESKIEVPPGTWDELMTVLAHERGKTYFYK